MGTSINWKLQRNGRALKCCVCQKDCNNTCSRCGEFYCSKQCQTDDWHEHKYHCFEMPELIMNSLPSNGQQSNNSANFQSNNRRLVQNLRQGNHPAEQVQSNSSQSTPRSAESRRMQNGVKQGDEEGVQSPRRAAFNFAEKPKKNDDVIITALRNANSFYIRTCCSDDECTKNEKDFDDYGRRGRKLSSLPHKNDIVLVRHERKFQRGVVLDVESEESIKVALADTGRKIHQPIDQMRQISDELRDRPRYNFIVTLDHIPEKVGNGPFSKLIELVNKRTVFKIQFDGNGWDSSEKFKLLEKDSGLPIEKLFLQDSPNKFNGNNSTGDRGAQPMESNRMRMENRSAQPVESDPIETLPRVDEPTITTVRTDASEIDSSTRNVAEPIHSPNAAEDVNKSHQPISLADFATESLPEVAELVVIDNSTVKLGYVSAVASRDIERLENLHIKVSNCGDAMQEVYEPKEEELCLVKFEAEWYRAINYMPKFLLIDWGNVEEIAKEDIRRFPEELKEPCYTFVCYIHGAAGKLAGDTAKIEQLETLLDKQSVHPGCVCVKNDEIMEYDVKFPVLENLF